MYHVQNTENDCGPIALCNAYEYSSRHSTLHPKGFRGLYREMVRKCEPNEDYGTYPWVFSEVARSLMRIPKRPTFKKERIMNNFNAFILLYAFGDTNAHYVFCRKNEYGDFNVYNYYDPEEDSYIHIKIRKEDFRRHFLKSCYRPKGLDYPQAWEVRI